ncbi:MAG: CDP-diacylglycerol--glycerol-3-phosphate 3-phosphatidyltransferase [Herpetosiphonaceae bacterium]|nr:MAG: CDP-diacylglycerol--glycerol-3-phosphate 3-phosphatidyltransferase [Herpetosiphonaceae bacterium]
MNDHKLQPSPARALTGIRARSATAGDPGFARERVQKSQRAISPLNLANVLSFSRMLAAAPLAWLILLDRAWAYLAAFLLFIAVAISDTLDGRLARRYGWVSNIGIFLDLTADKIYVAAMLVTLVQVDLLGSWVAIVILVREFIVTGLRSFAASEGLVIPAGRWGKLKMLVTIIALAWLLLKGHFDRGGALAMLDTNGLLNWLISLAPLTIWAAVVLTILSGAEYVWGARKVFDPGRQGMES